MKGPRALVCGALLAAVLLTSAGSASAGRIVIYRGETSTSQDVALRVLRRDSGRRFLIKITFGPRLTFTCNEGPDQRFGLGFYRTPPSGRLGDDGSFDLGSSDSTGTTVLTGAIAWRAGDGVLEYTFTAGTDECTSGPLTWVVDRMRSIPAR